VTRRLPRTARPHIGAAVAPPLIFVATDHPALRVVGATSAYRDGTKVVLMHRSLTVRDLELLAPVLLTAEELALVARVYGGPAEWPAVPVPSFWGRQPVAVAPAFRHPELSAEGHAREDELLRAHSMPTTPLVVGLDPIRETPC
jgi:hypothetical protein